MSGLSGDKPLPICSIVPSPPDSRDWCAENIYQREAGLPQQLDLTHHLPPVRNQGDQGSCAAQSAACMKEWQESVESDFREHMSPQYVYNLRENQTSEGMYCRDVMRILRRRGICPDRLYPYGKIESPDQIPTKVTDTAKEYVIQSYAAIHTVECLKKALYRNGPCLIAFPVYHYGEQMWKPTHPDQPSTGGHAMTVVGYTPNHFIIRNSWGKSWGKQGYCHYPISDWGSHWEVWTTIDQHSVSPVPSPRPKPEPEPESEPEPETQTSWSECLRRLLPW